MVRTAWDALRRRPGRSAVTSLGIGLAAALVVVLLAVSAGVQTSATQLATQSGVDLLGIGANATLTSPQFPLVAGAHEMAQGIPQNDSNVQTASPWLLSENLGYGSSSLWEEANRSENGSSGPIVPAVTSAETVGWIPSDNAGIEIPTIYSGAGFTYPGDPHYANGTWDGPVTNEIVLDQGLAGILNVSPGEVVRLGSGQPSNLSGAAAWYGSASPYTVVGISGPFWLVPSALLAFTYLSELQTLLGYDTPSTDYTSLLLVHLYDNSNAQGDADTIERAFPTLTLFTIQAILGAVAAAVSLYQTFGEIIAVIAVVVAALFTTTVLLMSVDDRSSEIALRRAIGLPGWSVGGSVVEEGVYLGAIGLAVGLPIAYGATLAIDYLLNRLVSGLPNGFSFVSFDPAVIATGVTIVMVLGLVASVAPALRAVRLPIAEELRAP